MTPDFTYLHDGLFYSILPENKQAEATVSKLLNSTGSNKLLEHEFKAFRKQARAAGYSVRKAKPARPLSHAELAFLLGTEGVGV